MAEGLTRRQQQILDFIVSEVEEKGYPPSVREIGAVIGLSSSSTVHSHLTALERKGFIKRDPSKRASKVRKWLTYMTLFVAAGVIIGDLTALVYGLLGGELSLRFALKALTVGFIAGGIFGYYLWDLRQEERETKA